MVSFILFCSSLMMFQDTENPFHRLLMKIFSKKEKKNQVEGRSCSQVDLRFLELSKCLQDWPVFCSNSSEICHKYLFTTELELDKDIVDRAQMLWVFQVSVNCRRSRGAFQQCGRCCDAAVDV